jgi:hypothetical protein
MASHLYVLSKVELSFAYPFLSLAYVAVACSPISSSARSWVPGASPASPSSARDVLIAQSGRDAAPEDQTAPSARQDPETRLFDETCHFRRRRFVGRHLAPSWWPMGKRLSSPISSRATCRITADVRFAPMRRHRSGVDRRGWVSRPTTWSTICRPRCCRRSVTRQAARFLLSGEYFGTENIIKAMDKSRRQQARPLHHRHDLRPHGHRAAGRDHPARRWANMARSKLDRGTGAEWRQRHVQISLFRPRLIIGPGRLGILEKLFKLID